MIKTLAALLVGIIIYSSCGTTEAKTGTYTLIVTGNVHSQLDPCG